MSVVVTTTPPKSLELVEPSTEKTELREFITTYLQQHNEMAATFEWLRPKLERQQREEWERTVRALEVVVRALDAGFDPTTPPKNWASGQLVQFLAPIPEHVRDNITRAEPIFGLAHILIYDPNTEHFSRPRKTDPLALGFVDLAAQRLHFLIGQWDIKADLKWIEGSPRLNQASQAVGQVLDGLSEDTLRKALRESLVKPMLPTPDAVAGTWKRRLIQQPGTFTAPWSRHEKNYTQRAAGDFSKYAGRPLSMASANWVSSLTALRSSI